MIDDGEDGNNQNLPLENRGGYWYTFMRQDGRHDRRRRSPASRAAPSR